MPDFWKKVDKTLRYHGRSMQRSFRALRYSIVPPRMSAPVFIVGCSRAGTTLVYKTFSEAQELGSLQKETHDFWADIHPLDDRNWDTHALSLQDAAASERKTVEAYFYSHTGKTRFVDKNNQNGLCIPYLHALFPDAYFVYVKRSPGDNINSLIEGWRRPEEFATWSDGLPEKVNVGNGEFTKWCFFLTDGWRRYANAAIEDVCAFQYNAMNQSILESRSIVPDEQWTEICYEDLLHDPVEGFRRAFTDIGIEFGSSLETHCRDVLSRPYNAFSEIRRDKWRDGRNAEKVASVLPLVSDVAREMGYDSKGNG